MAMGFFVFKTNRASALPPIDPGPYSTRNRKGGSAMFGYSYGGGGGFGGGWGCGGYGGGGYGSGGYGGKSYGGSMFVLIVILFILLIIVGKSYNC